MTLSIAARDPRTEALGIAIASSSPAVASRCVHLRAGVGAVASQNVTNPGLGINVLDILSTGTPAAQALQRAWDGDPASEYRQVAVVDAAGRTAVRSGTKTLGTHAALAGDGVAAAGNLLGSPAVVDAMHTTFAASRSAAPFASSASSPPSATDDPSVLEDWLLAALRAGLDAGGEEGPVRSAGLAVVEGVSWPVTDLRVDFHNDPFAELTALWQLWRGQKADYLRRALEPEAAPAYGVPGDPE
jgi:uncharacterized Ntn-hydrolase superfamily protein